MVKHDSALIANHTLGICKWIGEAPLDFYNQESKRALLHLNNQYKLEELLIAARKSKTSEELARALSAADSPDVSMENVEELLKNYRACQEMGHSHAMFKPVADAQETERKGESLLAR